VVLPARLRAGAGWDDACILNLSSRGLMVQAQANLSRGRYVELRRGPHVIVARVVWRDGNRAGLQAQDRLPVEQIVTLQQSPALQVSAGTRAVERRSAPRSHERSREQSRLVEFVAIAVLGASLSGAAYGLVADALAKPMLAVRTALDSR
jgi:hypothetical protein